MIPLLNEIELSQAQALCVAQAMQAVAEVDGVHPREEALIADFYNACVGDTGQPLKGSTYDAPRTRALLSEPAERELLIKSCVLVALADGKVAEIEGKKIQSIGSDLELDSDTITGWVDDVKRYFMSAFAGVSTFRDDAMAIGEELGLESSELETLLSKS